MSNRTVVDLAKHYNESVSRNKIVAGQIKVLKITESKTKGKLTAVIRIDRHFGLSADEIKNFTGRRFINQRVDFDPELTVTPPVEGGEEPDQPETPEPEQPVTPDPEPNPEPEPEPEPGPSEGEGETGENELEP